MLVVAAFTFASTISTGFAGGMGFGAGPGPGRIDTGGGTGRTPQPIISGGNTAISNRGGGADDPANHDRGDDRGGNQPGDDRGRHHGRGGH